MQKLLPLTLFALLLTACSGGGGGGSTTPQTLNVTGNWTASLQTTNGGGLGGGDVTLTQSTPPATDFKGTLTMPIYGGNHPLVGDAAKGTIGSDTSIAGINKDAAFSCTGTFTNTSYKGNCQFNTTGGAFILTLAKK